MTLDSFCRAPLQFSFDCILILKNTCSKRILKKLFNLTNGQVYTPELLKHDKQIWGQAVSQSTQRSGFSVQSNKMRPETHSLKNYKFFKIFKISFFYYKYYKFSLYILAKNELFLDSYGNGPLGKVGLPRDYLETERC